MAIQEEDYSPRYTGDTRPLAHTFTDHLGKVFPLTGVNATGMTLRMRNRVTHTMKTGKGTWFIDPAQTANGVAIYTWHADDVSEAGDWEIQAGVPFPEGFQHMDVRMIEFITPL
jgi:hypothetical protein